MDKIAKNYDAKSIEEKWCKLWKEAGIYRFDPDSPRQIFSVDTPPPYVSADHLHIGHAMSYIQAEIIVRHRRMSGYNVFYPMGFDDNGLPTERYVEKKHKVDKRKMSRAEFIRLCIEETERGAENYRQIWERLGVGVDWSLSYNTIGSLAQRIAQRSFIALYDSGLIYRQQTPNIWCPTCQTAISQADLDDIEIDGNLYYLRFELISGGYVDVATTRPEMLAACVSLYVNPDDPRYSGLIGQEAFVPIFGHSVRIRSHVDVDPHFGSGLMMVCTWGDLADVSKWREDKLEVRILIDSKGYLTDLGQHLTGMSIAKARQYVIEDLRDKGLLIKTVPIVQHKNIHERCKTPVEFNLSWQWYIKILPFKEQWFRRSKELAWFPQFMKERLDNWVAGLKWDWCISRDRYYGVPIPVWFCSDCNQAIIAEECQLPVDPRETETPNKICQECGSSEFYPEMQVLDTWMTSSSTSLINGRWQEKDSRMDHIYPMSLRVQAFEIIRTWMFYSIVKSHFHTDSLPWSSVMISGWGLDKSGKKMSKSVGNVVGINEMTDRYSADAVRWWSTNASLGQNLRFAEDDLKAGKKLTNKLWNVAKFCQPFIKGEEEGVLVSFSDQWIMAELQETIRDCTKALDAYDFNKARIHLDRFFWQKFCDTYLELCKDRSWNPERYSANEIDSMQFTITYALRAILKLFAPFIPFVTEEIYSLLFDSNQSIHQQRWPQAEPRFQDERFTEIGDELIEIINRIRHFKTNFTSSFRAEISRLVIQTTNEIFIQAAHDLKVLVNAHELGVNEECLNGELYETKSCKIILAL
ncbi:MAG: valine--tRNA ligase [Parcubacteria group bacterium]